MKKHILIPEAFVVENRSYTNKSHGWPQEKIEYNKQQQQARLKANAEAINTSVGNLVNTYKFQEDKESVDLAISFYGVMDKKFTERYEMKLNRKLINKDVGEIVLVTIDNKPRPYRQKTLFEELLYDTKNYAQNDVNKSYFRKVAEMNTTKLEDIVDSDILKKLKQNERLKLEVAFEGEKSLVQKKIDDLKLYLGDNYIFEINNRFIHYIRADYSLEDLEFALSSYSKIVEVQPPPKYTFEVSEQVAVDTSITVNNQTTNKTPVLLIDETPKLDHPLLAGAISGTDNFVIGQEHGTSVASLIIYGTKIRPTGNLTQEIPVEYISPFNSNNSGGFLINDNLIEQKVRELSSKYDMVIANFSINQPRAGQPFPSSGKVHMITRLFDMLSHELNCLFVVSAGNLFKGWSDEFKKEIFAKGYPDLFKENCTEILSPAESINSLSVGSAAYAESQDSISKKGEPTIISPRNVIGRQFIKPDLLAYDSNHSVNNGYFSSENNGPYMAQEKNNSLKRTAGTSFAAPLVANSAAILHNAYRNYNANTIKALLVHFASGRGDSADDWQKARYGFGIPSLADALYSLEKKATLVYQGSISNNTEKIIKIPVPKSLKGSARKRMRVEYTLVYNPPINDKDFEFYNPVFIGAQLINPAGKSKIGKYNSDKLAGQYKKSNVKKYPPTEYVTNKNMDDWWYFSVTSETKDGYLPSGHTSQNFSIIATISDLDLGSNVDLTTELQNVVTNEIGADIQVEIS